MNTISLRIIYALHMALPLGLVAALVARLDAETAVRLRTLFS